MAPLHFAIHQGHTNIVKLMLESGAQVDIAAKASQNILAFSECVDFI